MKIIYAKNNNGYKNLIKIFTKKTENEITLDDLKKYNADLICILPYSSINICDYLNKLYESFYIGYKSKDELAKLKGGFKLC